MVVWWGGGRRGGGSKYYGHYKMAPPTAEYKMLPHLPCLYICVIYSYHSISMPLIHKTLWLVKEAVVVGGGGGGGVKILWP